MRRRGGPLPLAVAAALLAGPVAASAWPTPPGETQLILKYERSVADDGFDPNGERQPILRRTDESASLFVEHGLSERITLQAKTSWTRGEDPFVRYSGRGPLELGVRYALLNRPRTVVGVYAGVIQGGVGRNAGYAAPGIGSTDYEIRVLGGRTWRFLGRPAFNELQVARLARSGLPDETRADATFGVELDHNWLLMNQAYAGRTEGAGPKAMWVKEELSATRRLGRWRVQAGWRWATSGRETPAEQGPILALWRTF